MDDLEAYPNLVEPVKVIVYNADSNMYITSSTDDIQEVKKLISNPVYQLAMMYKVSFFMVSKKFNSGSKNEFTYVAYDPASDDIIKCYGANLPTKLINGAKEVMLHSYQPYIDRYIKRLIKE